MQAEGQAFGRFCRLLKSRSKGWQESNQFSPAALLEIVTGNTASNALFGRRKPVLVSRRQRLCIWAIRNRDVVIGHMPQTGETGHLPDVGNGF